MSNMPDGKRIPPLVDHISRIISVIINSCELLIFSEDVLNKLLRPSIPQTPKIYRLPKFTRREHHCTQ